MKWIDNKLNKFNNLIDECYNKYSTPYISCSWGKDSILVMHLVLQRYPNTPVVYMNSGFAISDTYKFRDSYIKNIKNYYEVNCPQDYIELCIKYGLPAIDRTQADHNKVIKIIKKDVLDDFAQSKGWDCCIWGIRADETKGRMSLLKQHGLLYQLSNIAKCSPIGWWKGQDVWNCIDYMKIPYNPIYDKIMPPFFTRETIKNSGWLTTDKANKGRLVWLKTFYQDDFIRLAQMFPKVNNYV